MNTEQRRLMQQIYEAGFVLDEAVLYLDTHPCDGEALAYYEAYRKLYAKLVKEYTVQFGPLTADSVAVTNQWTWVKTPWPWEMEGC